MKKFKVWFYEDGLVYALAITGLSIAAACLRFAIFGL